MTNFYFVSSISLTILKKSVPQNREEFISLLNRHHKLTDHDILINDQIINDKAIQDIAIGMFVGGEYRGDSLVLRAAIYHKSTSGSYWLDSSA